MTATEPKPEPALEPIADLAAEEYVLGAMMLTPTAIDAVRDILQPRDFWRESHAITYRTALDLRDIGTAVDAITLADELEAQGKLERAGGRDRIREIATLVPAASNAPHHARIVARKARLRRQERIGETIARRAREHDDPDDIQTEAEQLLHDNQATTNAQPLEGLTHDQVLEMHLEHERELVAGLVPAGAVGTIAGVPETHKSWLAQAIAIRVARGTGTILGCEITTQGPVGYFWQDDSTREEAERVKLFEQTHTNPSPLPIRWFLNEGISLPQDLRRIRATVEKHHLVLIVLDSYYNFLPGIDLKDDQAEQVVSLLKREIADATGCTVLIVDHMPWATETNRGRLRAYGGVFKNAATRFGIYIDAISDKLHIEARGNNITGFPKRLAYWDADTLELKLAGRETAEEDLKAPANEILDWITAQGGDVEAKYVRAHFDIGDSTFTRRLTRLREMGVDYIGGRGKPGRLVVVEQAPESDTNDDQLDLDTPEKVQPTTSSAHEGTSPGEGTFPHNGAAQHKFSPQSTTDPMKELETPDLQGKQVPPVPPPYGSAPTRVRAREDAPNRLAAAEHWIDTEGWLQDPDQLTTTLITHFHTNAADLPTLTARAAARTAHELGQVTNP